MKLNVNKTKWRVIGTNRTITIIKSGREKVEQVSSFKYLENILNEDMKCENNKRENSNSEEAVQ